MDMSLKQIVDVELDNRRAALTEVSAEIWKRPELAFNEFFAHDLLTRFLEDAGFAVTRSFVLPTAFIGEYSNGAGPRIAILCEYDALPEIGHACGHNLMAMTALEIGLLTKRVMQALPEHVQGSIAIVGTPAEEYGGGKVLMIDELCKFDAAIIVHPGGGGVGVLNYATVCSCIVTAAFSSTVPHTMNPHGRVDSNLKGMMPSTAMDAAVICQGNLTFVRKTIPSEWRIASVIRSASDTETVMDIAYRALKGPDMASFRERIEKSSRSAASTANCSVKLTFGPCYLDLWPNHTLSGHMLANLERKDSFHQGIDREELIAVSTDVGNVSQVVPGIQPLPSVHPLYKPHQPAFTQAVITVDATDRMLDCGRALALTAVELLRPGSELLTNVRAEFAARKLLEDGDTRPVCG